MASGSTLTILGCGTMGIAILSGILRSLEKSASDRSTACPGRFIACVRRDESGRRISQSLPPSDASVSILVNENVKGVQAANIVLLACKPQKVASMLAEDGIRQALDGKLLISILAGVSVAQIESILRDGDGGGDDGGPATRRPEAPCRVVRAMPNTASFVGESMTVIAASDPPLPAALQAQVTWILNSVGRVVYLPPTSMDAATALCGSGPAFMALVLEAVADGAVAMGLPRAESQMMAAQVMRGTAALVLDGEHPAILRDKVSTPGGCTIGGLLVLEEGRVRGTLARAVREATVVAGELGKGTQGVNGTRF